MIEEEVRGSSDDETLELEEVRGRSDDATLERCCLNKVEM